MDRRTFLLTSSGSLAAVSAADIQARAIVAAGAGVDAVDVDAEIKIDSNGFKLDDWRTISIVQNHLFPSDTDAPGAVEINALDYLHRYLTNPATDKAEIQFLLSGTHALQHHIHQALPETKEKQFSDLSIAQREALLREFEQQADGKRWLTNILNYLLEALLTDPVYGGNPDGIGWKWLQHRAGEPRPPYNKRYWLV